MSNNAMLMQNINCKCFPLYFYLGCTNRGLIKVGQADIGLELWFVSVVGKIFDFLTRFQQINNVFARVSRQGRPGS